MLKRVISLLLASVISFSCIACARQAKKAAADTVCRGPNSRLTPTLHTSRPNIEKGGFQRRDIYDFVPQLGLYVDYFLADEQTGDQMSDAIYSAPQMWEEYLGIDIDQYMLRRHTGHLPTMRQVVSGDDYQLVLTHCIQDLGNMMVSGLLLNWNTIPHQLEPSLLERYDERNFVDLRQALLSPRRHI